MGCCCSKESQEEDDVNAPLLGNEVHTDSRMNYQALETIDVKQEQEFWNEVIDRTTQNLIDISSSQADPLQEQDIQERMEKYHDLLQQIPYSILIKKKRTSFHYGKTNGMTTSEATVYNGSTEGTAHSLTAPTVPSAAINPITPATSINTATTATTGTLSPHHFDIDPSTVESLLAASQDTLQEHMQWLDQAVLDVEQALQKLQVQPVGDIVIHLTMPDSNSLQSY